MVRAIVATMALGAGAAVCLAEAPAPAPCRYAHGLTGGGPLLVSSDGPRPATRAQLAAAFFKRQAGNQRGNGEPGGAGVSPARTGGTPVPPMLGVAGGGVAGGGGGVAGGGGGVAGGGPLILYPFLPMGGTHEKDIFIGGFVDLDPSSPAFHDYNCGPFTRDGHEGADIELRSFAEQIIGVPVFAPLDGTVTFASDGFEDLQLGCTEDGNIIAIDHGGNRESSYFHLKKNSVLVSVGQPVKAGQQIGMVGSSGCSFGPHLHFQTVHYLGPPTFGYELFEPFAGLCRPGPSGWVSQPPLSTASFLGDFGPTSIDLADRKLVDPYPFPQPRQGQFAMNTPFIRFWLRGYNLPIDSTWRVRFFRPGGAEAWDSNWFFSNSEIWRTYFFTWEYDFQKMKPEVGVWHILVEFNGQTMINAPFEVVTSIDPPANHAPESITVSLSSASPAATDVILARVGASILLDDLDYDVVRYRYVWKVNGATVRDVTTAAQSDAIARNSACPAAIVQMTVTPNDGKANGAPVSTSVTVAGSPTPDLNCDGHVNGIDLALLLGAWSGASLYSPCPPFRPADLNHDCRVNGLDLAALLAAWAP